MKISRSSSSILVLVSLAFCIACGGGGGGGGTSGGTTGTTSDKSFGSTIPTTTEVTNSPKHLSFGAGAATSADLSTSGYLPAIGDQGQLGSCVAWAVGYGLTSFEAAKAAGGQPTNANSIASPEDLYEHVLSIERGSCGAGTNPADAFTYLTQSGVQSLATVPYSTSQCTMVTTSGGPFALSGYTSVMNAQSTAPDDVGIKQVLSQGHPVAIAIQVPSDFVAWGEGSGKTGIYKMGGSLLNEGHMLLVVGFDDSKSAYKIMNSWGTSWGSNGFFWMDYNTFDAIVKNAYAASGATVIPPVNPVSNVTMSVQPTEYFYYGYYYLVIPFQLSEPLFVNTFSASDPNNGTTGNRAANVWASTSYVWFVQPYGYQWYPGAYSLTFNGTTRDGRNVTVTASGTMIRGNAIMRPPAGTTTMLAQLPRTREPASAYSQFAPGLSFLANGIPHIVGVK